MCVHDFCIAGIVTLNTYTMELEMYDDLESPQHTSALRMEIDDAEIAYTDTGQGKPLIFIHGFPFDQSTWQEQAAYFRKTRRVITYDIRGFGASTAGRLFLSIPLFADDLVQLMDALKIPQAVVCGLSMGGYIALNAVSRYPERFEALVLCDTQCIADSAEAKEKRFKSIAQVESEGLQEFAADFTDKVFSRETHDHRKDRVIRVRNIITRTPVEVVSATLKALAERSETCSILEQIRVPVLIICGEEDGVTPLKQSQAMQAQIAGAVLETIPGAGHLSNMDQPEGFNSRLETFLNGLA